MTPQPAVLEELDRSSRSAEGLGVLHIWAALGRARRGEDGRFQVQNGPWAERELQDSLRGQPEAGPELGKTGRRAPHYPVLSVPRWGGNPGPGAGLSEVEAPREPSGWGIRTLLARRGTGAGGQVRGFPLRNRSTFAAGGAGDKGTGRSLSKGGAGRGGGRGSGRSARWGEWRPLAPETGGGGPRAGPTWPVSSGSLAVCSGCSPSGPCPRPPPARKRGPPPARPVPARRAVPVASGSTSPEPPPPSAPSHPEDSRRAPSRAGGVGGGRSQPEPGGRRCADAAPAAGIWGLPAARPCAGPELAKRCPEAGGTGCP